MDTALFTFMLQTSSSTQSVHLIGSWDNFSKHYPMIRDSRRARTEWRGCYSFEDIICDGDGGSSSPKRSGGLRMGSTYYYYYELNNGTEHYDDSIPFTTACPYLPGQPVNTIEVPIEVQPLRSRSASLSSLVDTQIKTMNPAAKFMAPRQPPPLPQKDTRLQTSTSILVKKRSSRSLSPPKSEKSWSPRSFFGLRSPSTRSSPAEKTNNRGRSASTNKLPSTPENRRTSTTKKTKSVPHTRTASPRSFGSRTPSPLCHFRAPETAAYIQNTLLIPDEIAEEVEEDYNFASYLHRTSGDNGVFTPLAPPPSSRSAIARSYSERDPLSASPITRPVVTRAHSERDTYKPLPGLPETSLRLTTSTNKELPRSHFSTSTISTCLSSPTASHYSFSDASGLDDDDDFVAEDNFAYSPTIEEASLGFGYSLPEAECASEQTIRKGSGEGKRKGFGEGLGFGGEVVGEAEAEQMGAMEQLMKELGYLGEMIVRTAI